MKQGDQHSVGKHVREFSTSSDLFFYLSHHFIFKKETLSKHQVTYFPHPFWVRLDNMQLFILSISYSRLPRSLLTNSKEKAFTKHRNKSPVLRASRLVSTWSAAKLFLLMIHQKEASSYCTAEKCKPTNCLHIKLSFFTQSNFWILSEVFYWATIDFGRSPSAPGAKNYFAHAQRIHPSSVKQSNLKDKQCSN